MTNHAEKPQPLVLFELHDHVAVIVMNRPEAMNAMSRDLRLELVRALDRAEADTHVRAIVLTGAGNRAFTAGLDLNEISTDPRILEEAVDPMSETNPLAALARCSCPVIAAVNGVAITGGLELMLGCDMAICSSSARFADTHASVGIIPGWGLSQKLSRIIGPGRAREMHYSARLIDAKTAEHWGLVNCVVAAEDLMQEALDLARSMATHEPKNMAEFVNLVREGFDLPLGEAMALETTRSRENYAKSNPTNLLDRDD